MRAGTTGPRVQRLRQHTQVCSLSLALVITLLTCLTVHAASSGTVQPYTALNLVNSWAERTVPEMAPRA